MKKGKLRKTFSLKDLELLIQDENSCVELHKKRDHLALHPYHLTDLNDSVQEILNKKIRKFCPHFDGILCGYKNIKFLSKLGNICEDSCFIHVDIEADFFIFKPLKGKVLEGVVNKKSKDHIGCLVHKIFNVSLPRPKKSEAWLGEVLDVNSKVKFKINYTNFDGKLPYIRGEIVSALDEGLNTNEEIEVEEQETEEQEITSYPKKKKKKNREMEDNSEISPTKKKKRKNRDVEDNSEMEPPKKQKKKSKELGDN